MRIAVVLLALLAAGCAVTTSVVMLDPKAKYEPTDSVEILLQPPKRPYVEIAKLESRGAPGEPETSVREDARETARKIGADAIIVQETVSTYQPPIVMYDPWPAYLPWHYRSWHGYPYWYYPSPFMSGPQTYTVPGGYAYTVRSIAIKYQ